MKLRIASRASSLARAQVDEVLRALNICTPAITFDPLYLETYGDCDLTTSLRNLDRTDFFTRELDLALLEGRCRIAIHAAKDLPSPLPTGLSLIALTRGVASFDSLVLREGVSCATLPLRARIGVSSARREEAVRAVRSDLLCVDIRGVIERRLSLLDRGLVDGVVMAEAALIRLQLLHRNRVRLACTPAPLQGRLAIVARSDDAEMRDLFSPLHYTFESNEAHSLSGQ